MGNAHSVHEALDTVGVLLEQLKVLEGGLAGEVGSGDVPRLEGLLAVVGVEVGREDGRCLDDVGVHELEHAGHGGVLAEEEGCGGVGESRGGGWGCCGVVG